MTVSTHRAASIRCTGGPEADGGVKSVAAALDVSDEDLAGRRRAAGFPRLTERTLRTARKLAQALGGVNGDDRKCSTAR